MPPGFATDEVADRDGHACPDRWREAAITLRPLTARTAGASVGRREKAGKAVKAARA